MNKSSADAEGKSSYHIASHKIPQLDNTL